MSLEAEAQRARAAAQLIFKHDPDLPISARREAIMQALRRNQVLIVAGDTGSGKSTQLPQYCLELGPRHGGLDRAYSAATPGGTGSGRAYRRGSGASRRRQRGISGAVCRQVSEATRLVLMTDGLLLAELASDPLCGATTPSSSMRRTSAR